MIDKCISILRTKLNELHCLLNAENLPEITVQKIKSELERMEQIIDNMEKGRD